MDRPQPVWKPKERRGGKRKLNAKLFLRGAGQQMREVSAMPSCPACKQAGGSARLKGLGITAAFATALSIRKIAGATGLSSSRIHQLLNAPEAKEIPVGLQSGRGSGGKKKAEQPEAETEIRSRLAREVEVLRECLDWLQGLERGENVVVNLRPDADAETEFVGFDPGCLPWFRARSWWLAWTISANG